MFYDPVILYLLLLIYQMKLSLSGLSDTEMTTTDILQAQVRDARKVAFKLEEVRQQPLNGLLER